jgi:hypothetical protein
MFTGVIAAAMAVGSATMFGQATDAAQVLAGMQAALGGVAKVQAVKTVSAKGTIQRVTPRGTTENETTLAIELPDKYMVRSVVSGQGSMTVYRNTGFSGEALITVLDAPPNLAAAASVRDRARAAAAATETPEERAAQMARQVLTVKKDFARMTLGLFGASYAAFPLEFRDAGEAESGDGTARIVEARGADDFLVQLFVDSKTHLPLMMRWTTPGTGAAAGRTIERRTFYSNFKKVDGLTLPHTIQLSVDGTPTEETTFSAIEINGTLDRNTFATSK